MELQSFPFDTQELAIRVGTTGRAQNEIVLQTNPTQKHVTEFDFALAEWNLVKASSEDLLTDPRWSAHKLGYHQVHIKLVVKRKHGYYMFSIVLILFLLGQLVWLTFLINPQDFSDRFNTNLALMLTAITYKSLVDEHLPKMNWLTVRKAMDWFILGQLGTLVVVIVENAAVAMLARTLPGTEEEVALQCEAVDRAALCILLSLSFVAYIKGGLWAYREAKMPKQAEVVEPDFNAPHHDAVESEKRILKKASFRSIE